MIVNDAGEYESMSEDEFHALNKVATPQEGEAEDNEIYCDGDNNPSFFDEDEDEENSSNIKVMACTIGDVDVHSHLLTGETKTII